MVSIVEYVDEIDRQREHRVAFLDLPLYHVNHTVDRVHLLSSLPEVVLSIGQIWIVLREMSRDTGSSNSFENLPHIAEEADRYIRPGRGAIRSASVNDNQLHFSNTQDTRCS